VSAPLDYLSCAGAAGRVARGVTFIIGRLQDSISKPLKRKFQAIGSSLCIAAVGANCSFERITARGCGTIMRRSAAAAETRQRELRSPMSNVVIIASTGAPSLLDAVQSVLNQTVGATCYVICDGEQYRHQVSTILNGSKVTVCYLPRNVGANGYYGHRIYAAFSHLVDEDFVFFLDQDNSYLPTHVETCVSLAESSSLAWVYSLRNIVNVDGSFICRDNCESLGKWASYTGSHLIDTSAFCVRRQILMKTAQWWHGKWGQDRIFTNLMLHHFPNFDCTGKYTLNYRLGGNPNSVKADFFRAGNRIMQAQYGSSAPWEKE